MPTEVSRPKINRQIPGGQTEGGESYANGEISLFDLVIALLDRKGLILSITVFFFIGSIILSLVLPKVYTAKTTILPPQQSSATSLVSQLGSMGGMAALAGGTLGMKSPNDMLIALMRSRTVEEGLIKRFDLMREYKTRYMSDARKDLENASTIEGDGKDGLIHLSVRDGNAKRAAELANGYVDEFRTMSEHLAITEAGQRRLFFEQQLEQTKNKLADAEEALKETEQKTGAIQPAGQAASLIQSAAVLRAQIAAKEVEIHSLETFATAQNAEVIQAKGELQALRNQLAKLTGSTSLSDDSLIIPSGKVPEVGLQYLRRLRDVKYYETIFDILSRQYESAKLDEAKEGALIQVVDPAAPPDRRSSPQRTLIVLGATFGGFVVAVFLALVLAGLEHVSRDKNSSLKMAIIKDQLSFRSISRMRRANRGTEAK